MEREALRGSQTLDELREAQISACLGGGVSFTEKGSAGERRAFEEASGMRSGFWRLGEDRARLLGTVSVLEEVKGPQEHVPLRRQEGRGQNQGSRISGGGSRETRGTVSGFSREQPVAVTCSLSQTHFKEVVCLASPRFTGRPAGSRPRQELTRQA